MSNTLLVLEHVKQLGVQFETPEELGEFLIAIRHSELKIKTPISDEEIAKRLEIPIGSLRRIIRKEIQTPHGPMPYSQIATQILLINYFTDERKEDRRSLIYGAFDELLPLVIKNQLQIAAGRPGMDTTRPPSYRDQVDAAKGVLNNPITMSYMKLLLTGKDDPEWKPEVPSTLPPAVLLD